jgi:hypothetical protein
MFASPDQEPVYQVVPVYQVYQVVPVYPAVPAVLPTHIEEPKSAVMDDPEELADLAQLIEDDIASRTTICLDKLIYPPSDEQFYEEMNKFEEELERADFPVPEPSESNTDAPNLDDGFVTHVSKKANGRTPEAYAKRKERREAALAAADRKESKEREKRQRAERADAASGPKKCKYEQLDEDGTVISDCLKSDCSFAHVKDVCEDGSDCRNVGCSTTHRHYTTAGKFVAACDFDDMCVKPDCNYLHPCGVEQRIENARVFKAQQYATYVKSAKDKKHAGEIRDAKQLLRNFKQYMTKSGLTSTFMSSFNAVSDRLKVPGTSRQTVLAGLRSLHKQTTGATPLDDLVKMYVAAVPPLA